MRSDTFNINQTSNRNWTNIYQDNPTSYEAFLYLSKEFDHEMIYLQNHLPQKMDRLFKPGKNKRILDVGCGEGSKSLSLLSWLEKNSGSLIDYFAIDPASNYIDEFRQKIYYSRLTRSIIYLFPMEWEKFPKEPAFDFLYFSHSFYYLCPWEKTLEKIRTLLKPNGKALIAMQHQKSSSFQFVRYSQKLLGEQERTDARHAEELLPLLEKKKMNYTMDYDSYLIDFQPALDQRRLGIKLLEFYLRRPWKELSLNIREHLLNYLQQHGPPWTNWVGYIWLEPT